MKEDDNKKDKNEPIKVILLAGLFGGIFYSIL